MRNNRETVIIPQTIIMSTKSINVASLSCQSVFVCLCSYEYEQIIHMTHKAILQVHVTDHKV